jgi:hypothetical protein
MNYGATLHAPKEGKATMMSSSLRLVWVLIGLIGGCTSVTVTPELPPLNTPIPLLHGRIEYHGNQTYLPRTVAPSPSASEQALTLRYETTEIQEPSDWDVIALFNPFSLIGFPTGHRSSTVKATLDILENGNLLQSYAATSEQDAIRGIYYGASFSELRRQGLIAVRNSIEAQMAQNVHRNQAASSENSQNKEQP